MIAKGVWKEKREVVWCREQNNACQDVTPFEKNLNSKRVLTEKSKFDFEVIQNSLITEETREVLEKSITS